jgi:nucleoside-diphosphate-sugar epimerase
MKAGGCALVIGGTRGTGLAIARLLAGRGYGVRVLARHPARAEPRLDTAAEIVAGDITKPETLPRAVRGADHIIFTAGVHSGRIARESLVRLTDHDGVLNTLAAARGAGFAGRFLYLNSLGVATPSLAARLLNLLKRNTLVWRRRAKTRFVPAGSTTRSFAWASCSTARAANDESRLARPTFRWPCATAFPAPTSPKSSWKR